MRDADALLMAAAVADFRPAEISDQKIKKGGGVPTVTLARNPDILAAVAERNKRLAIRWWRRLCRRNPGPAGQCTSKLERKGLDLIAANDVSAADAGFAVETNRVTLLYRDGHRRRCR